MKKPILTASGFARRDVGKAMCDAIAEGNAERACCLAAELASARLDADAPHAEVDAMIDVAGRLVDVYATFYASVDVAAIGRVASAIHKMSDPSSGHKRRAVCEAVVAMALGLPRQDATAQIIASAYSCPVAWSAATVTSGGGDHHQELAALVRQGRTAEAVRLVHQTSMFSTTAEACAEAWTACTSWMACASCVPCASWQAKFVSDARQLFYHGAASKSQAPTKAVRTRRANLAMCAVLVASSRSSRPPPPTWAGEHVDRALGSACALIDGVFEEIAAGKPSQQKHPQQQQQHPPPSTTPMPYGQAAGSSYDEGASYGMVDDDDDDYDGEDADDDRRITDRNYLKMYTTIDFAAQSRAEDSRHESRVDAADMAPLKTIVLVPSAAAAATNKKRMGPPPPM